MRIHTIMLLPLMLLLWKFILYGLSILSREKGRKKREKKRRREEKKIRREESVSMVMLCYHYRDSSLCRYVLQQLRFVME